MSARERPIPFSAPMVRAILEGRKWQTRRIVRFADPYPRHESWPAVGLARDGAPVWCDCATQADANRMAALYETGKPCPYGVPGDRLWVREAWRTPASFDALNATQMSAACTEAGYRRPWAPIEYSDGARVEWQARDLSRDDPPGRYRHARFMPRWASRISLEITEVRVERLQEIAEGDARAEGFPLPGTPCSYVGRCNSSACEAHNARPALARLWDEINGKRSPWAANPWVWVVSFQRCES